MDSWYNAQLELLKEQKLFREIPSPASLIDFCTNDYLGLSKHPLLKKASCEAIEAYGTGVGASRLVSASTALHQQLEDALSQWCVGKSALLLNSGYQAGVGIIPAIAQNGIIFSDEYNHASLIDGCRLSHAKTLVYRHRDIEHLEALLKTHPSEFPRWIITESLFSMEGDKAPLKELADLKNTYKAALFLDEAHAIGIYGETGKGLAEEEGCLEQVDLVLGTFSKALGSYGAYVVGDKMLVDWITNVARSFIFTTALPPSVVAANREAILLCQSMQQERKKLASVSKQVRQHFANLDFAVSNDDSPIIPLVIGEAERALHLSQQLQERGLWIRAIRPPSVPQGTSRLRMTTSLSHTEKDYELLFDAFRESMSLKLNQG